MAARLGETIAAHRWLAIGLSGMIPTLVTLGRDGRPSGPAITWQDARDDEQGDEFRERCGAAELYRLTGQWVDGRYLLPMFGRIARDDPGPRGGHRDDRVGQGLPVRLADLASWQAPDSEHGLGRLHGCYELEEGRWKTFLRCWARRRLLA